jgi:hypothetical protein
VNEAQNTFKLTRQTLFAKLVADWFVQRFGIQTDLSN